MRMQCAVFAIDWEENNKYVNFFSSSISISFHPLIIMIIECLLSIHIDVIWKVSSSLVSLLLH